MANTISLNVITLKGEDAGTVEVSAEVFGVKDVNPQVVKNAVTVYQANLRQATAKTKKRHEVHGTNKKPWRQKGTGRARAGDVKSPIWVGGGIVFGPDGNQNYSLSQNKKEHNLALRGVLSEKAENKGIVARRTSLSPTSRTKTSSPRPATSSPWSSRPRTTSPSMTSSTSTTSS